MKQSERQDPAGLTIRPMTAGDIDPVLELERASGAAPHWSREAYESCLGDQTGSLSYFSLVAELSGVLAGFAVVRQLRLEARGASPAENECELESIAVRARLRHRGIGSRLLQASMATAQARGAKCLMLEVRESNQAAIGLYLRSGFRSTGRRPGYYVDPVEDAVLMTFDLEGHHTAM